MYISMTKAYNFGIQEAEAREDLVFQNSLGYHTESLSIRKKKKKKKLTIMTNTKIN